jgi:hypothetical protein
MADDVEDAVAFHTTHVGFTVRSNYAPASLAPQGTFGPVNP